MAKTPQTQKEFIDYRFNETIKSIESVEQAVKAVNDKLDTTYATKDFVELKTKDFEKRLNEIEEDKRWLTRAIIGGPILTAIAAILITKGH